MSLVSMTAARPKYTLITGLCDVYQSGAMPEAQIACHDAYHITFRDCTIDGCVSGYALTTNRRYTFYKTNATRFADRIPHKYFTLLKE